MVIFFKNLEILYKVFYGSLKYLLRGFLIMLEKYCCLIFIKNDWGKIFLWFNFFFVGIKVIFDNLNRLMEINRNN